MNQNYLSSAERRAYAILDAYGSWSASWPIDERQAVLECIAHSPALQCYQAQLEDLDARILSAQAAAQPSAGEVHDLQLRILAKLPAQTGATHTAAPVSNWMRIINWLIMPRHTVVLAAITILALVLVMHHTAPVVTIDKSGGGSYAAWSWYDITGQELPASHTTTALTMTDFINLELDQDGG